MGSLASRSELPAPRAMPIVGWRGNILRFFRDPIAYMDTLPWTEHGMVGFAQGMTGGVFEPWSPGGGVIVRAPSLNQSVLGRPEVFHAVRVPGPTESASFRLLTSGLFAMNGEAHASQRKLILPAFHRRRLEAHSESLEAITRETLDTLRVGATLDVYQEMKRLTLRTTARVLFGIDPTPGAVHLGEQILRFIAATTSPLSMIPLNLPMTPRRRVIDLADELVASYSALIAERRKESGASARTDVLSLLLEGRDEAGVGLTEDEVIAQTFALFFAGHSTTAGALTWTIFLLSQHPEVMAAVHDEVSATLRGGAPTLEHLGAMPLLTRAIDESLRLLPPVPFTLRRAVTETELGGVALPARTDVIVDFYHAQRAPEEYNEPRRFKPERWIHADPRAGAWLPFGIGPRACIGASLASMQLKIVLSMLIQQYRFELAPGAVIDQQTAIVLLPRHGLPMVVRAQDRDFNRSRGEPRGNVFGMFDPPDAPASESSARIHAARVQGATS